MSASIETFADRAINYFLNIKPPAKLSPSIKIINPYEHIEVKRIAEQFYKKFFSDNNERIFVFGINPGRFGGGLTGISFTDPVTLREYCGIENSLGNRTELSSKFIYKFISEYGGVNKFFTKYFLSALFPLAIIKNGNNYNYYDEPELINSFKPYIISSIKEQTAIGAKKDYAICLGRKNFNFFMKINDELNLYKQIFVLDHPRYIMQYKTKSIKKYLQEYFRIFRD